MILPYNKILKFWFEEINPEQRWKKDKKFDILIMQRFSKDLEKAANGEFVSWRSTPEGSLAEIIILDQFSRHIYRDTKSAFMHDNMALALAQNAVAKGYDNELNIKYLSFLYMPYMHSESKEIHKMSIELFNKPGLEDTYDFAVKHKNIIDRFGRYPHRNKILGRQSTKEELAFLNKPGSSF